MHWLVSVHWSRGSLPANSNSTRAEKCLWCRTHRSNKGPRHSLTAQSFYNLPRKTVGASRDRDHRETGFAKLGDTIVLNQQTQICQYIFLHQFQYNKSLDIFWYTSKWSDSDSQLLVGDEADLRGRLRGQAEGVAWWKPSTCSTLKGREKKKKVKTCGVISDSVDAFRYNRRKEEVEAGRDRKCQ